MSCCQNKNDTPSQENQSCCQNKKKGFFGFFSNLFGGKQEKCCKNHTEQKAEEGCCCKNHKH